MTQMERRWGTSPKPDYWSSASVQRAFASYWRRRNAVMADRLVPVEVRRAQQRGA